MKFLVQKRHSSEFRGLYKRGSESILASPHFKDIRSRYTRKQLSDNFYGPKEWYLKARNRMKPVSPEFIAKVAEDIKPADSKAPRAYPFVSSLMKNEDDSLDLTKKTPEIEEQKKVWENYRFVNANLYPSSAFAVEERVLDAWNYYCDGEESKLTVPRYTTYGGYRIALHDRYRQRFSAITECPEGVSGELFEAYTDFMKQSNPAKSPAVNPDYLASLVDKFKSAEDVSTLLPGFVQRWRQMCIGNMHPEYSTPDQALSDAIIQLCCKFNSPETALNMLRHKNVFKLDPTINAAGDLMASLALRHLAIAANEEGHIEPEIVEKPKATPKKRQVSRREFPFRQGPRYYFYQKLPFVLNPEPNLLSEITLPSLPDNNETKRLLPDDQRKMMAMLIEEAETNNTEVPESPAVSSLTDLYRLYSYFDSPKNPCYYPQQQPAEMLDYILLAGALGGTKEGSLRNEETMNDILSGTSKDTLSMTGVSALAYNNSSLDLDSWFKDWPAFSKLVNSSVNEDPLRVGFLSGVYGVKSLLQNDKVRVLALLESELDRLNSKNAVKNAKLHDAFLDRASGAIGEVVGVLRESGDSVLAQRLEDTLNKK